MCLDEAVEDLRGALSHGPEIPAASLVAAALDHLIDPVPSHFTRLGIRSPRGSSSLLAVMPGGGPRT